MKTWITAAALGAAMLGGLGAASVQAQAAPPPAPMQHADDDGDGVVTRDEAAADADRQWREQQVRAYAGFLRSSAMPMPNYSVSAIRRADLPRAWKPLPALGFLRSQFI